MLPEVGSGSNRSFRPFKFAVGRESDRAEAYWTYAGRTQGNERDQARRSSEVNSPNCKHEALRLE